ncbi:DUF3300 domain-containing protein [Pseudocolwellia agarivorans]|uniref:DUF3300 domain-containing protein n=1 Tax=Pseudocolwellia agarivorans TaxID=1911682 RepID=UPI003F884D87
MKRLILSIGLLSVLTCNTLSAQEILNQASSVNSQATNEVSSNLEYNQEQLAQMLAPVALYPDSLLTHILIASTYPIEVVEAERWVTKNKNLSASKKAELLEEKDWEPSVTALTMFPDVLERMVDDLTWTQQLGDAFLQSEENVLSAIQGLRIQADKAGNLAKMENVEVSREANNIVIEPVEKEIVYVPYYDSRHVYGHWHSSLYPPVYWNWGHRIRYTNSRPFGWNAGIHISWNYFFSGFSWSNRHVVVINHRNTRHYQPKKVIVRSGYSTRWVHNPKHRKGVRYSNRNVSKRYGNNRPVVHKTVVKRHNSAAVNARLNNNKAVIRANNSNRVQVQKNHKHEVISKKLKVQKAVSQQRAQNIKKNTSDRKHFNSQRSNELRNKTYAKSKDVQRSNVQTKNVQTKNIQRNNVQTKSVQTKNIQRSNVQKSIERSSSQQAKQSRQVRSSERSKSYQSKPQRTQRSEKSQVRRSNSGGERHSRRGDH